MHDERPWTWSTGWIWPSIVGLALVGLQGRLLAGPRGEALKKALMENGPGRSARSRDGSRGTCCCGS